MKIKIFYMVYGLQPGGLQKYSIDLYSNIDRQKYQFDFITLNDDKQFYDNKVYELGGNRIPLKKSGKKLSIFDIIKLLKKYDIAYFNLSKPSSIMKLPLLCKLLGTSNIIIHSHNSYYDSKNLADKILIILGRHYSKYIAKYMFACSEDAATWMFGNKVVKRNRYLYIKNGIDSKKYEYNKIIRDTVRNKLFINRDALVIGHIGRFEEQKNHKFLLDIFSELKKLEKNSYLILVGNGSRFADMKSYAKEIGIDKSIYFLGERNDVSDLLQAMDIFVLPSLFEGLPIAGVEAQASGLICFFSSSISRKTDITGNVRFLNLADGPEIWAKKIYEDRNYKRTSTRDKIIDKGFDISETSKKVSDIFDQMTDKRVK